MVLTLLNRKFVQAACSQEGKSAKEYIDESHWSQHEGWNEKSEEIHGPGDDVREVYNECCYYQGPWDALVKRPSRSCAPTVLRTKGC